MALLAFQRVVSIVIPGMKTKIVCVSPALLLARSFNTRFLDARNRNCFVVSSVPLPTDKAVELPLEADLSEPLLHWFTGADTLKADGPQTARTEGPQNCGFPTEPDWLQTGSGVNPHQLKPNACESGRSG